MLINSPEFLGKPTDDSIRLITLGNRDNISVQLTNYGARLVTAFVPDRQGNLSNVIVGYKTLDDFIHGSQRYFGATIGRFANRIANAAYTYNGQTTQLQVNRGKHQLHGGTPGFNDRVWTIEDQSSDHVKMSLFSPNGENGFPGDLKVYLTFTVLPNKTLELHYQATTSAATPINLTNHSYFNLSEGQRSSIYNHSFLINASHICEVDSDLIPSGRWQEVEGGYLDLRQAQILSQYNTPPNRQYDNHYLFGDNKPFAQATDLDSGRQLSVKTTKTGMQFYTSDSMKGNETGYYGQSIAELSAFCFETQFAPDSCNHSTLDNALLLPEETYQHTTWFDFSPNA